MIIKTKSMENIIEYLIMLLLKVLNLKGIATQYAKKSRNFKTFIYLDARSNVIAEKGKEIRDRFKKEKNPLYYNFYDPDPNISYIIHKFKIWIIIWYNRKKDRIKKLLISKHKVKIMAAKKYVLKDIKAPVLKGKEILKDPDAGGIKLTYEVANEKITLSQKDNKRLIYLKPYKENWSISKKDANKGEWGNTSSLLSNVWLEIKKDYSSYEKESTGIRGDIIKDSNLIAYLNKQTKEFTIGSDESIRNISLKLKILFKIKQILDTIKSRVFLK